MTQEQNNKSINLTLKGLADVCERLSKDIGDLREKIATDDTLITDVETRKDTKWKLDEVEAEVESACFKLRNLDGKKPLK